MLNAGRVAALLALMSASLIVYRFDHPPRAPRMPREPRLPREEEQR